jgi:hypothetical protein
MLALSGCNVLFAPPDEQVITAQEGKKLVASQFNTMLPPLL